MVSRSYFMPILSHFWLLSFFPKQLNSVGIPVKRCRQLEGCNKGGVSLAVNGRVGRRVACVLDNNGTRLEVLDVEGEEPEMDEL
jgi:anaphase-promoting complex subunit 4